MVRHYYSVLQPSYCVFATPRPSSPRFITKAHPLRHFSSAAPKIQSLVPDWLPFTILSHHHLTPLITFLLSATPSLDIPSSPRRLPNTSRKQRATLCLSGQCPSQRLRFRPRIRYGSGRVRMPRLRGRTRKVGMRIIEGRLWSCYRGHRRLERPRRLHSCIHMYVSCIPLVPSTVHVANGAISLVDRL